MAEKLSFIDLNRDDKAHNFVVSLNAFQDGNRLAYLALAIAIGIDSLIFMAWPVRRQFRALALVGRAEHEGAQLAAAQRHDRDGAAA